LKLADLESASQETTAAEGSFGLFSQEEIFSALLDVSNRKIVMSVIERGKMVEEISEETHVPLSTCYRKVADLAKCRILVIERMVMTPTGKKYAVYRSAIAGVHIDVGHGQMSVSVLPNAEVSDKLRAAWLTRQANPALLA